MQKNSWQNFTDEGHLFYMNGMIINRGGNFTDEGHVFCIQLPWYADKQVAMFYT